MNQWTEDEIAFIIEQRDKKHDKDGKKLTWVNITVKYNKKFRISKGLPKRDFEAVKKCHQRYEHYFERDDEKIQTLKKMHRTKKSNSATAKENRTILQLWNERDELIDIIENTVQKFSLKTYKLPKVTTSVRKKNMTLELLFSDIHYGKLIDDVDGK